VGVVRASPSLGCAEDVDKFLVDVILNNDDDAYPDTTVTTTSTTTSNNSIKFFIISVLHQQPGNGLFLASGLLIALMIEAVSTYETSVNFYQNTRRNIPQDSNPRTRHHENMKSQVSNFFITYFLQ
jgi:hypothetical protein